MGNKNETGLFDGESRDVITPSYQSWSVADMNTHMPNLDQMLTGNWDLNSTEHENCCSQKFGLNQNQQTAICNHNEQCRSQTGANFGFVPQTDLKLYDGESVTWENLPDVIQLHYIVRDTGLPNFLKTRIPVNTNLNIKNWRHFRTLLGSADPRFASIRLSLRSLSTEIVVYRVRIQITNQLRCTWTKL